MTNFVIYVNSVVTNFIINMGNAANEWAELIKFDQSIEYILWLRVSVQASLFFTDAAL